MLVGRLDVLERLGDVRDGFFDWQTLHRTRAVEAVDAFRSTNHVLCVFGLCNRAAVAEHENVRLDSDGGVADFLDEFNTVI